MTPFGLCRRVIVVRMAVSRIWYPEPMSPPNFGRVPSSVESCLQWQDTAPERSVVNSQVIRTSSVERCDVLSRQQQLREASPTRGNIYCHYDGAGRNALYDARQQAARQDRFIIEMYFVIIFIAI